MKILEKETTLYSILKLKCPKCHEGNLFTVPNAWNLNKMLDMPDHCPVCGQDFRVEPGFYTGALWPSYPIVVIIGLLLASLLLFFPEHPVPIFITIGAVLIFLQPIIMRWGRAIWIHIFVSYDPSFKKE
jgi:uncharacterized protein (DUF983 family)